jgi:hypothetical protein
VDGVLVGAIVQCGVTIKKRGRGVLSQESKVFKGNAEMEWDPQHIRPCQNGGGLRIEAFVSHVEQAWRKQKKVTIINIIFSWSKNMLGWSPMQSTLL